VTELTVVVFFGIVVEGVGRLDQGSIAQQASGPQRGNYILVSVMRKLDGELLQPIRIGEKRARTVARRGLCMTNTADHRGRSFEKLRPVTANAGVVSGN
jgi:hypothetical protein